MTKIVIKKYGKTGQITVEEDCEYLGVTNRIQEIARIVSHAAEIMKLDPEEEE